MSNGETHCVRAQQQEEKLNPEMKEKLDEVGFTFYLILARVYDLDPKLIKVEGESHIHINMYI